MRVNSVVKGFLNHRLVTDTLIALVVLTILVSTSSFTKHRDRDLLAKQTNLVVRQIGHELLLQSGDSTSQVLPVTELREGTFLLAFENDFVFDHDSLIMLTQRLLPKTQYPSGYTVTVHDCSSLSIAYGFQINRNSPDNLACRGRHQPRGCYTIEIAFTDLYAGTEKKITEVKQQTRKGGSVKVVPEKTDTQVEEIETIIADNDNANLAKESRSYKSNLHEANTGTEEGKTITFDYPFISLVGSGMLVLLSVALLIGRFGKKFVPLQNHDHAVVKESPSEGAELGKFLFDTKEQRLLSGAEVINLTDKECRILSLLHKNFGELISRETLMQEVWINEGVITGRSLDMFVSKLRKKLSSDPGLKITNVHGKGYKLESEFQDS